MDTCVCVLQASDMEEDAGGDEGDDGEDGEEDLEGEEDPEEGQGVRKKIYMGREETL